MSLWDGLGMVDACTELHPPGHTNQLFWPQSGDPEAPKRHGGVRLAP
jgi:hypothetical protein